MPFSDYHALGWGDPPKANEVTPYKTGIFKDAQLHMILLDALLMCQFPGLKLNQTVELVQGITGWDTGLVELMRIAERILTLMRLFNLREGVSSAEDKMPERYYQPTQTGPLSRIKVDREGYEKARRFYYVLMGWDANGVPLPEKVAELGIT
jgi:aldehyde:ferredoxin oxidoreductase